MQKHKVRYVRFESRCETQIESLSYVGETHIFCWRRLSPLEYLVDAGFSPEEKESKKMSATKVFLHPIDVTTHTMIQTAYSTCGLCTRAMIQLWIFTVIIRCELHTRSSMWNYSSNSPKVMRWWVQIVAVWFWFNDSQRRATTMCRWRFWSFSIQSFSVSLHFDFHWAAPDASHVIS